MGSTSKCTCGERFKKVGALAKHCRSTGHERPGWLKKMDAQVEAEPAEEVGDVDWGGSCENCGASPVS